MDKQQQIVVCIKAVVMVPPRGKRMVRTAENSVLNPYDRTAISAAIDVAKALGASVTALSMGPPQASAVLYEALAMGADRAVLAADPAMAGSDTLATSRVLAAAIQKLDAQVSVSWVVFGVRTADSDTGQVGPQTAALLGRPMLANVDRISPEGETLVLERRLDGFVETLRAKAPAVMSIHPRLLESQDIALGAIGAVYDAQTILGWDLAALGLAPETVGESGSPTCVNALRRSRNKRSCRWIEGDTDQQAQLLLDEINRAGLLD